MSFNLYDPHGLCREYYGRLHYPWIHRACHWLEEDPWRYFYNSSRFNEPIIIVVEWLATLKATTQRGETITTKKETNLCKTKARGGFLKAQRWIKATILRKTHLWKRWL